jgi:hypothetical protein
VIAGFRETTQNRVDLPTVKYVYKNLRTLLLLPRPSSYVEEPMEYETGRAWLTGTSGVTLEKVCEYLYYSQKHAESKDVPDMDIPPELCLELLIAADFLDGMCGQPISGSLLTSAV